MSTYRQEPEIQLLSTLLAHFGERAVVDVGAERGGFAEALLRAGGNPVHVVEPEPSNAESLRERFARDPRVAVHEYAITDVDASLDLHKSVDPSGEALSYGHTILTRAGTDEIAWNETIAVARRSLASLLATGELPARVGILKVDTEGNDLAVVSGMGPLECDAVMVEHWADLPHSLGVCPWTAEEMVSAFRARGFSQFALFVHQGEFVFLRWNDATIADGLFGNLLFLHDRVVERVWPVVFDCATRCAESAIADLGARLREVEEDRQARLETIRRLDAELREVEADSQARLETIERLDAELKSKIRFRLKR